MENMNYFEINGKLYPCIAKYDMLMADYDLYDCGIEVIIIVDSEYVIRMKRKYNVQYNLETHENDTIYGEPTFERICTLTSLKTEHALEEAWFDDKEFNLLNN